MAIRSCARLSTSPDNGHGVLLTLGFDPTRFQTEPPACYRASWQLPGPDSHRQAPLSFPCPSADHAPSKPDPAAARVWTVHAKVRPVGLVRWRFPLADLL